MRKVKKSKNNNCNTYRFFNGKYYNTKYFNDNFKKCHECEEYHPIEEMTDVGDRYNYVYVCEDCINDYSYCESCNTWHLNEDLKSCDWCDKLLCPECILSDGHGTEICESCYRQSYPCEDCGRYVSGGDIYYCEYDDGWYCGNCINSHNNNIIHDYDYKPDPVFYGEGLCYFGVELEVDKGYNCESVAEEIVNNNEEIYCKHDGSLNDGFEIVSHPCTLEYHLNNLQWEDIITTCINNDFKSHDAETCGLHVHVSRTAFGKTYAEKEMNIAKLLYIFEKFWSQIKKFSRRTDEQIASWAKNYGLVENPEEILNNAKGKGRYYAVNLCNDYTIEIRIFRGTLNYNTFAATLQFCQLVVDIVNNYTVQEIQQFTWQDIIDEVKNYEELTEYFKIRKLI